MQVRSWIDVLVLQADQHTKSMNEDYEYFFRWYSEDMYKIQVELFYYRELQREIKTESLREVPHATVSIEAKQQGKR